jgi:DNA primase
LKLSDEVAIDAGLGRRNSIGRVNDFFRGRVLFPIFDAKGDPVGFGGRILPGAEGSKYWNWTDNPIYSKSKVLYGLNWAKSAIVNANQVIVCEGYTDVIGFARAGLPAAVATCGTALTTDHVKLLRRYARKLVLSFDADAAGLAAAERFYQWEKDHELEVAVAALPAGVDRVTSASRRRRARRLGRAGHAVPRVPPNRVLDAATSCRPRVSPGRRSGHGASIAEHPSDLVRDQYLMEVASRCRIEADRLRAGTYTWRPRPPAEAVRARYGAERSRSTERPPHPPEGPSRLARDRGLAAAHHHDPELVALHLAPPGLFGDGHRAAYVASFRPCRSATPLESADPASADLLQRLAEETEAEADDVVARLVEEATRRELSIIQFEVVAADEETVFARSSDMAWLKMRMEELRESSTRVGARDQLLAWLAQRPQEIT